MELDFLNLVLVIGITFIFTYLWSRRASKIISKNVEESDSIRLNTNIQAINKNLGGYHPEEDDELDFSHVERPTVNDHLKSIINNK